MTIIFQCTCSLQKSKFSAPIAGTLFCDASCFYFVGEQQQQQQQQQPIIVSCSWKRVTQLTQSTSLCYYLLRSCIHIVTTSSSTTTTTTDHAVQNSFVFHSFDVQQSITSSSSSMIKTDETQQQQQQQESAEASLLQRMILTSSCVNDDVFCWLNHCWTMSQHSPCYALYYHSFVDYQNKWCGGNNNNNNDDDPSNNRVNRTKSNKTNRVSKWEKQSRSTNQKKSLSSLPPPVVLDSSLNNDQQRENVDDRMIRKALYAMNRAQGTIDSLARQEECLNQSDRQLDEIEDHLRVSDRLLRGMTSLTGTMKNLVTLHRLPPSEPHYAQPMEESTTLSHSTRSSSISDNKNHVFSYESSFPVCVKTKADEKFVHSILAFTNNRNCIELVNESNRVVSQSIAISHIQYIEYLTTECHFRISFKAAISTDREPSVLGYEIVSVFAPIILYHLQNASRVGTVRSCSVAALEKNRLLQQCLSTLVSDDRLRFTTEDNSMQDPSSSDRSQVLMQIARQKKRKESDEKQDQMLHVLVNLKNMAHTMGDQLDKSNIQLDKLSEKVDKQDVHINKNVRKMERLM